MVLIVSLKVYFLFFDKFISSSICKLNFKDNYVELKSNLNLDTEKCLFTYNKYLNELDTDITFTDEENYKYFLNYIHTTCLINYYYGLPKRLP